MQTWLVHMREPRQLLRDLGLAGFLAFQLIVGGNVLAALVHPLFMAGLIYALAIGAPIWHSGDMAVPILAGLYGATVLIGYFASALLGWVGLARRRLLSTAWVLLFTPVHWMLLSLASWRAVYQLIVTPYAWEKTEHGLAKSSRRTTKLIRSLLELEQLFGKLKKAGKLPTISSRATVVAAAPRPQPRIAARGRLEYAGTRSLAGLRQAGEQRWRH